MRWNSDSAGWIETAGTRGKRPSPDVRPPYQIPFGKQLTVRLDGCRMGHNFRGDCGAEGSDGKEV